MTVNFSNHTKYQMLLGCCSDASTVRLHKKTTMFKFRPKHWFPNFLTANCSSVLQNWKQSFRRKMFALYGWTNQIYFYDCSEESWFLTLTFRWLRWSTKQTTERHGYVIEHNVVHRFAWIKQPGTWAFCRCNFVKKSESAWKEKDTACYDFFFQKCQ